MNQIRILNVYKWATMGGVERVFLNRAHAFKNAGLNVKYDVHFLYDSGGITRFQNYIESNNLEDHIELVSQLEADKYDVILSVDTPEIFDYTNNYSKVFLECHTSYKDNRSYIRRLPYNLGGIIVPSNFFAEELKKELPGYLKDKIYKLSNFTVESTPSLKLNNLIYGKTPLLYLGRLDKLKNIEEILQILADYLETFGDDFILILAGPIIEHEISLQELLIKYDVVNRVVYLPPIDFEYVNKIFQMIVLHKGIFISSSKSETFGLSCAEAIYNNIPTLLSSITAHEELVNNDSRFLYRLGNIKEASQKLHSIQQNYSEYKHQLKKLQYNFSDKQFLKDWISLIEGVVSV
ncbi:glycosyltransferase [Paenibacillus woosongensis]|uniref:Glycosyltransferase n=1 Tax=Paenibacillus woosongensis TaxID=307580 RepID=A0A7X2Z431_9BACL|nr:glycosyltransferase [Paenibacillus woosongensis]MUG47199.1 glycosyltransferase [Paenibacillus woosongensis]